MPPFRWRGQDALTTAGAKRRLGDFELVNGGKVRVHAIGAVVALALALSGGAPSWAQNRRGEEHASHSVPRPPRVQQGHAGQWLRQHNNLPPEQQRRALQSDPQFRNLPPQQKQHLENQLTRFNSLPPQQRQQMLRRMDTFGHLTPEQKDTARQMHSQMQTLPAERRQAVRNAIQALRAMPPDARQRQIDSDAYRRQFSPQERSILGGASRLPLAPAGPNGPE